MVATASRSCTDWSSPTPAGAYESLPAQVHVLIIVNAYSDCSEKSIPWMFTSSSNSRHEHGNLPQNWQVEDDLPDIRLFSTPAMIRMLASNALICASCFHSSPMSMRRAS